MVSRVVNRTMMSFPTILQKEPPRRDGREPSPRAGVPHRSHKHHQSSHVEVLHNREAASAGEFINR